MNKQKRIELRKEKIKYKKEKLKFITKVKINNIENRILNRSTKERLKNKLSEHKKVTIKNLNSDFQGYKKSLNNDSFFSGLRYETRTKNANGYNDFYTVKNSDNVDNLLQNVFEKKNATGALIILEIERNNIKSFFSKYITLERLYTLQELEMSAIDDCFEAITFKSHYEGFKLLNIHIRIIYENPKTRKE